MAAVAFPSGVLAANDGPADLDKATELRPGAQSTGDLTDVINLCESAIKKGLNKNDTTFANDLMASALAQRGTVTAAKIFGDESSPRLNLEGERWKTYRTDALADLEKALKLSPKQPQAHYMYAKLNLLPGGDADKALAALNKTVEQSEDDAAMRAKALLLRRSFARTSSCGSPISRRHCGRCRTTRCCSATAAWRWPKTTSGTSPWPISTSRSRPIQMTS